MGIQRLSTAVVSSLRTDVTVTTSAQCVTELVLNSIDAKATAIAVRIDLQNFRIQVIDNGRGLSKSDLNIVGTRYMTSKCHSLQDLQTNLGHFGFRGEALSSIAEVCGTLTIVSRCVDSEETFCKVFTQGTGLNVGKSRHQRASCGTTVTVSDFLYNRPVRRARIKPALDLEDIKSHIESIALINPNVSFSLRNDANNDVIMQTQRSENIPSVFGTLFGDTISENLVAVQEIMGPFKVEGYISREAYALKNLQFIYVNKRLLLKTKLHKLVNSIMSRSAILKSNNIPHVPISKEINHGVFLAFSPPKRDKHAIFVLNITCPLSEYDITLDPKKTLVEFCNWDCLLSCFESLLRNFIEKEAGLVVENNKSFDSAPPRKVKTVIDEINELARVEALGGNIITQSSDESISTRHLSRAVHSLPANRHQVNLSPDPSLGCVPSTVSSELLTSSTTQDGKDTIDKSSLLTSSAFTEKPYPPILNCDSSRCVDKNNLATKHESRSAWTENSSIASPRPKFAVEQLHGLFKKPHASSLLQKKPTKGFITNTIHFEETFRKIPDIPLGKKPEFHAESAASPVNALASIKEIRRKKLLNNLNKFSFKTACKKPVLKNTLLSSNLSNMTKKRMEITASDDERLQANITGVDEICKQGATGTEVRESKVVHTAFTPMTDHDNDSQLMTSQIATIQSTINHAFDFSGLESSGANHILANSSISNALGSVENEVNLLDSDRALESERLEQSVMLFLDKADQTGSKEFCQNDFADGELRNIVSVEDMIVTGFDIRCRQSGWSGSTRSSHDNKKPSSLYVATSTEQEKLPTRTSKSPDDLDKFDNLYRDVQNEDLHVCGNSISPSKSPNSNTLHCEIEASPCGAPVSHDIDELCSKSTFDVHLNTNLGSDIMTNENLMQNPKLVDYDSSPCSSQESTFSVEGLIERCSSSPSKLKRKQDIPCEQIPKKNCVSPERFSHEKICSNNKLCPDPCSNMTVESTVTTYPKDFGSLSLSVGEECSNKSQNSSDVICPPTVNCTAESSVETRPKHSDSYKMESEPHQVSLANNQTSALQFGSPRQDDHGGKQMEWVEEFDDCGKPFYIHRISGITSYQRPKEEKHGAFKFNERFTFLPKGMSPILNDKFTNEPNNSPSITHFRGEDDLSSVKWEKKQAVGKTDFWPLVDLLLAEADNFSTNVCTEIQVANATVQELSQSDIKVYNVVFPYSFSKSIFQNLRVLGQLDNKFIVTIATLDTNRDVIVLFDQHAVHERIRVENLTEEYKHHDGSAIWKSAPVEPTLPLPLSSIEVRILENYKDKIERLGLSFSVIDSNTINILRVPTCLLLRENREVTNRGVSVLRQHLESLIREQVDSLLNTRGVGTDHPSIIRNVISSEACRGAVKFGHSLTVADCQAFLHNLSSCNLPFQCAHGRPALVPIVDLSMLKQKPLHMKPNLYRLKKQPPAT